MKVFSFCLYGTERNYYIGLLENIKIIHEFFPDFEIHVFKGICDPSWVLDNVVVHETNKVGPVNMFYRVLPIKTVEIGFIRDADSRITERDRWTINRFLGSSKNYHIIRDHYYHRSRIMGGLFGWKKPMPELDIVIPETANYGDDEALFANDLYPRVVSEALIHTNIRAFVGEHSERIAIAQRGVHDFIGNVIWNEMPRFDYFVKAIEHVEELSRQDQFELICYLTDSIQPLSIPYDNRTSFFDRAYTANYYIGNLAKAQFWLREFEFADINAHTIANSQYLIPRLGKVIASFDAERNPAEGEVVIVYGNYPDWHLALPGTNKMFRHVKMFNDTHHDVVEYHPSWESFDRIYILNLEERVDRYYETLLTLAAIRAPLHRIYHYKAKKDGTPAYIGATQNHVDVMEDFEKSGSQKCLILEDDFVFIDDKSRVWNSIVSIPEIFDICFLSISKTQHREPLTEMFSRSHQACTTSSGYILQKPSSKRVYETAAEGLRLMKETGDHHTYCIDRYWTKLPNILYFATKLGFQRPCYSNLIGRVVDYLD